MFDGDSTPWNASKQLRDDRVRGASSQTWGHRAFEPRERDRGGRRDIVGTTNMVEHRIMVPFGEWTCDQASQVLTQQRLRFIEQAER